MPQSLKDMRKYFIDQDHSGPLDYDYPHEQEREIETSLVIDTIEEFETRIQDEIHIAEYNGNLAVADALKRVIRERKTCMSCVFSHIHGYLDGEGRKRAVSICTVDDAVDEVVETVIDYRGVDVEDLNVIDLNTDNQLCWTDKTRNREIGKELCLGCEHGLLVRYEKHPPWAGSVPVVKCSREREEGTDIYVDGMKVKCRKYEEVK